MKPTDHAIRHPRAGRVERLSSLGLVAATAALLLLWLWRYAPAQVDFTPIWLAGRMWAEGHNPYGDLFVAIGRRLYPDPESQPHGWFYPPQWWLPCILFAQLPLKAAAGLWMALSLAAFAGAIALLWRIADRLPAPPPLWLKALMTAWLLTAEGTKGGLLLGQTSFFLLLAFALVIAAVSGLGRWMAAVGLVLLFMKPQIGAVVGALLLVQGGLLRPILIATGLSAIAALPPLILFGPVATIGAWLHQIGLYMGMGRNLPAELVGIVQITSLLRLPSAATPAIALALFLLLRAVLPPSRRSDPRMFAAIALTALGAALPLHAYDTPFLAALVLLGWPSPAVTAVYGAGLLLLHRARTIAALTAPAVPVNVASARIDTAAVFILLIGTSILVFRARSEVDRPFS